MISIRIYTSEGSLTFQEEIADFSLSLKNKEGLLFNASLPMLMANVVVHSTAPSVKNIKVGDEVVVSNAEGNSGFRLVVISVTVLDQKGVVEIACADREIYRSIYAKGVYDLSSELASRMPFPEDSDIIPPAQGKGIINEPADALLSYVWGRQELQYITYKTKLITPFSSWAVLSKTLAEKEEWQFTSEDIIDYDIMPANQPVTEITTPLRGKIALKSGHAVLPSANIVKPFYIEEYDEMTDQNTKGSQCVYMLRRKEDSTEEIDAQILTWSDGHITDLGTVERRKILGVFKDSFIEFVSESVPRAVRVESNRYTYKGGPVLVNGELYYVWSTWAMPTEVISTKRELTAGSLVSYLLDGQIVGTASVSYITPGLNSIYKYDKMSMRVISRMTFDYNIEEHFELSEVSDNNIDLKTVTSVYKQNEVLWCNIGSIVENNDMFIGIASEMFVIRANITDENMRTPSTPYHFVGAQRRRLKDGDMFNVLYMSEYYVPQGEGNSSSLYYMSLRYAPYVGNFAEGRYGIATFNGWYRQVHGRAVDMFDEGDDGDQSKITVLVNAWTSLSALNDYTVVLTFGELSSQYQLLSRTTLPGGYWQYVDSNSLDAEIESEAARVCLYSQDGPLEVRSSDQELLNILHAPDSKGAIPRTYVRNKSEYLYAFEDGTAYTIVIGTGFVPWSNVTVGEGTKSYRLAEGEKNSVHLPFIVAPLDRLEIPAKEKGRIAVTIMSYRTYPDTEPQEVKYIKDLDLPLLMSTVIVKVADDMPAMKMRVTGIELMYGGLVQARISGILV